MTLDELLTAVENSSAPDWTVIHRPIFAQDVQQVSGGGHPVPWIEVQEHNTLLSFRSDLSISIALGIPHLDSFSETWANGFPDPKASSEWVDFRYNGVPVFRSLRVLVDGARAGLPCPASGSTTVSKRNYWIWHLIDEAIGSGRMADYFSRAGLTVDESYWPKPGD